MPYSIMIDAGHGGNDPGAVYKGRREKDDNFAGYGGWKNSV